MTGLFATRDCVYNAHSSSGARSILDHDDNGRDHPLQRAPQARTWRIYTGITASLILLVVALVGGIIWYNASQLSGLMIAQAERLMVDTGEKVTERLRLLYDPIYAIVGLSSHVSDLTAPVDPEKAQTGGYRGLFLMLRGLRIYPQIMSLYVGFENGDFFMVTHLTGENAIRLHAALDAPEEAVFASEIILTDGNGQRLVRWFFLAEDGTVISSRPPIAATFDPRDRPWYVEARKGEGVKHSALYIFASSGEPGFTLSRQFGTPTRGVFGADLAASDIVHFLRDQRVTPGSTAFIFTRTGEVVAVPDGTRMAAITRALKADTQMTLPKISDFGDPLLTQVFARYKTTGTQMYDIDGRSYVSRVIEIPARYGQDQLLGVMVPVKEIAKPVVAMRNEALFRSIVIVVLVLPIYATLIVGWIDRRLGRHAPWVAPVDRD